MIKFKNWQIIPDGTVIARQYDNGTRTLVVEGDLPEGWTWVMLVTAGKHLDLISLVPIGENQIGAELSADMLAVTGRYTMQLRGTQGERVRHTNKIVTVIPSSMSGDVSWPVIPSEFTQIEQRIQAAADKYPRIGDSQTWLVWDVDTGRWIDTEVSASGGGGETGTADDAIEVLDAADILHPLYDGTEQLFVDANGNILTL